MPLPVPPLTVEVTRGGVIECRHRVHLAVADASGRLLAGAGDPELVAFLRSSAKPLQALALVESGAADAFGLSARHVAMACASHHGLPVHVHAVGEMLALGGMTPDALRCGPHAPTDGAAAEELRRAGRAPERIHNNCSGKHAGMLLTSVHRGWDPAGYLDPDHPLQRWILDAVAVAVGPAGLAGVGVDGCGVPTFACSLRGMATAFARLASGVALPAPRAAAAGRLAAAMAAHPELISGPGSLNSDLLARHGDRVATKGGAEGVWCVGLRGAGAGLGLAIKVEDGAERAVGPALLATLGALGLPGGDDAALAERHGRRRVRNTRGEAVGQVRAAPPAGLAPEALRPA